MPTSTKPSEAVRAVIDALRASDVAGLIPLDQLAPLARIAVAAAAPTLIAEGRRRAADAIRTAGGAYPDVLRQCANLAEHGTVDAGRWDPSENCYCGGPEEIYPHRYGTGRRCRTGADR